MYFPSFALPRGRSLVTIGLEDCDNFTHMRFGKPCRSRNAYGSFQLSKEVVIFTSSQKSNKKFKMVRYFSI